MILKKIDKELKRGEQYNSERSIVMAKFYGADFHFGHENSIKMDGRPFSDKEEMKEILISNWNEHVTRNDDIYLLGDIIWKNEDAEDILKRLKGRKHLFVGNHDRVNDTMKKYFVSIDKYDMVKDEGRRVFLCHYPVAHWSGQFHGTYHLYGHVHGELDGKLYEEYRDLCISKGLPFNAYNVGIMRDYMNWRPQPLDVIIAAHSFQRLEKCTLFEERDKERGYLNFQNL